MIDVRHVSVTWDTDYGPVELRFDPRCGSVTGHWKAWDGKTYHNTATLILPDGKFDDAQIKTLAYRAYGRTEPQLDGIVAKMKEIIRRLPISPCRTWRGRTDGDKLIIEDEKPGSGTG